MCGIAGFAGWTRSYSEAESILQRMCGAIRHRGPDDEGHYIADGVGLGMRRLSIIDVAGGRQPISNESGDVQVVFNGEIYNHHEIRRGLVARGHHFSSHADTEVIVHLYEERGERVVADLRGMFGIAVWDERRRRLVLARDRLGIKPLYYWPTPDGVAFASELRSFLALDGFPTQLNRLAIARYLSLGYIPDPLSIFQSVRKLPPGHLLFWSADTGVTIERYWTPVREEDPRLDEVSAAEELQARVAESVGLHLESEVPLGAFLSGGIDSSTVVAEMARQMDRPVQTFSIGFEDPRFNEAPDAARVARVLGTDHTERILRPDADRLVDDVVRLFDEPFADSSALPTYLVAELARTKVTVALSGDGGDELFGGYTRYGVARRRAVLPSLLVRKGLAAVARRLPHAAPARNRILDLSRDRRGRYASTVATPLAASEGGLARAFLAAESGEFSDILHQLFEEASSRDFATQMMLVDTMSYLPGDILTKVDRTTMAASLEARVPLLDHKLVEFAVSVPSRLKMRDGTGKWLLRRAIEHLVPPFVLLKPKKGFSIPLGHWFRHELKHRVDSLLRPHARINEFVDPAVVRRLALEHRLGRRDHSSLIWRLMTLDLWLAFLERGDLSRSSEIRTERLSAGA